jgi:glycosyltransferase involved in cell wall biosynthesis
MAKKFELVLPCYNEAKSIEVILNRAIRAAKEAGFGPDDFQVVLVENGSRDNSLKVMNDFLEKAEFSPWFRVVPVVVNKGYGFGVWSGLLSTSAPVIAWSHADQQCDPADAFRALREFEQAKETKVLVKGIRHGRSLKEQLVSRVFELIAWFHLGYRFYELNAQPKVFSRELLKLCPNPPNDFALDLYVIYCALKNGFVIKTINVEFPPRVHGFSNWANGLKSRSTHIKNMVKYIVSLKKTEGRIPAMSRKELT